MKPRMKSLLFLILLSISATHVMAQSDAEFYKITNPKLQKKYKRGLNRPDVTVGLFYGSRSFYFEEATSEKRIHLDMRNIVGLSASIENQVLMGEVKFGFGDHKTMFAGRAFLGLPIKWTSRFRFLPYIGGGYSAMIAKGQSSTKLLGTLDLGAKIRMKYFVTDNMAIYAGAYGAFLLGGKSTYKERDMISFGFQIDGELGVSFAL